MRDLDQALARAYAGGVTSARTAATPPSPHFAIDAAARPVDASVLAWPETVLALERSHGDRFEALADSLLAALDAKRSKILYFTSCHRAEGRTTLVLTLARALARRPGRTLLVDGDLGGPMLARSLGLRPRVGLGEVVEDGQAVSAALVVAPDDNLTILPLVAPAARPREFLASEAWSSLMGRLRREFDLVLIDGGPLFTGLSASALPLAIDAAVLVRHASRTPERAVLRARDVLDAGGIPLLGLAETFS